MTTIAVVDYGMGNLRSVAKAMEHVAPRTKVVVSSSARVIAAADRVVFPGQGAAQECMANLESHELKEPVKMAFDNKPFLGICMGLQVLFEHSAENNGVPCMGTVNGTVVRFKRPHKPDNDRVDNVQAVPGKTALGQKDIEKADHKNAEQLKIPHMGWNEVSQCQPHELWNEIEDRSRFYFVHSYYVQPSDKSVISGTTEYNTEFCSAIAVNNVFATQFHPEKSAGDGLRLLKNFSEWDPR